MATVGGRQQDEQSINFHSTGSPTHKHNYIYGVTLYYMNKDNDKINIYIYIYI